jgi:hypothetical protein
MYLENVVGTATSRLYLTLLVKVHIASWLSSQFMLCNGHLWGTIVFNFRFKFFLFLASLLITFSYLCKVEDPQRLRKKTGLLSCSLYLFIYFPTIWHAGISWGKARNLTDNVNLQ